MKLFASIALLAGLVSAQRVQIESPTAGTSLQAGEDVTIQVGRSIYIQNMEEVGLAIGIQYCSRYCGDPSGALGQKVLYRGSFDPQGTTGLQYQNFTVTIPEDAPSGEAHITWGRLALVGASEAPFTDFGNITVNIA